MNRTESPPHRDGATEPAAVPERPALAPDVHLIGQMQGTGFKDRQWLIQRRGRFLQVTELLTDVTDSYRLGRWARVRTDLGGVYFHLIVALGLIVFSAIAGGEFLLAAALVIDLQVIRQFLPRGGSMVSQHH